MAKNGPEFCVLAQRQICIIETTDVSTWLQNSVFSQKRRKYLLYLFRPSSTRLVSNERQLCLLCHCCWPWRQKLATIPKTIIMTDLSITSPPCPSSIIVCLSHSRVFLLDLTSFAIIKAVFLVRFEDSFPPSCACFLKVVFCFYGV